MQLDAIIETATDLFAEEKQNLYIDKVAEIQAWARVAKDWRLPETLDKSLCKWVEDGLHVLRKYFDGPSDEIVETSVNFELLFIRVVTLARLRGLCQECLGELRRSLQHESARYCPRVSQTASSAFTWSLQ